MAPDKFDLSPLRGALILFVGCALLSIALIAASRYLRGYMRDDYEVHKERFRAVSAQYLAIDEEGRIIQQHLPEFLQLQRAGIIGAEHRLDWLESLRAAGATVQLPELGYSIASQAPYAPEFAIDLGQYDLRSSRMTLDLGLLHEGDLLRVFDILDEHAGGLYTVANCGLAREGEGVELDIVRTNISARCELQWYTVALRGGLELQP